VSGTVRNVVLGRLRDGVDPADLQAALDAIEALDPPGLTSIVIGRDLRLREESWDFAITSDFVDEDAYRTYDLEDEHNRIRREMFAPICADIARVQVAHR